MANKVDHATAEAEFTRWAEAWEIDTDTANMSEEDRDSFNSQKAKLLNAIKRGRLSFDEEKDALDYILAYPDNVETQQVTMKRPGGAGLMEMDKYKERENVHKTYAVLGEMTGKTTAFFSKLDGIDVKPFLAVSSLFLAS
jgi:hypothetical protein